MRVPRKKHVSLWLTLVFLSCATLCAHLRATDGVTTEEESTVDDPEMEEPVPTLQSKANAEETPFNAVSVNRPWQLETPAGQTAFVLDPHVFQVGAYTDHVMDWVDVGGPLLLRYGLTDRISVGLGSPIQVSALNQGPTLIGEAKWNFLNSGLWSFAVRPWVGYHFASGFERKDAPFAFELAASRVLSESARLHVSVSYGQNTRTSSYSYLYTNDTSYYNHDSTLYKVFRLTAALEWRMRRRHGLTFSLSPQYRSEVSHETGTSGDSDWNRSDLGLLVGVFYSFLLQNFGFSVGMEAGPTSSRWGREASTIYLTGMASPSLSVDYRF